MCHRTVSLALISDGKFRYDTPPIEPLGPQPDRPVHRLDEIDFQGQPRRAGIRSNTIYSMTARRSRLPKSLRFLSAIGDDFKASETQWQPIVRQTRPSGSRRGSVFDHDHMVRSKTCVGSGSSFDHDSDGKAGIDRKSKRGVGRNLPLTISRPRGQPCASVVPLTVSAFATDRTRTSTWGHAGEIDRREDQLSI